MAEEGGIHLPERIHDLSDAKASAGPTPSAEAGDPSDHSIVTHSVGLVNDSKEEDSTSKGRTLHRGGSVAGEDRLTEYSKVRISALPDTMPTKTEEGEKSFATNNDAMPAISEPSTTLLRHRFTHRASGSRGQSVIVSMPTFEIRDRMTPQLEACMKQIYEQQDPVDEGVWGYLSPIAVFQSSVLCVIALWSVWIAPFLAGFSSTYSFCTCILYFDIALDAIYIIGVGMELNMSKVDMERRVEIRNKELIRSTRIREPTFYIDILSCCVSTFNLLLSDRMSLGVDLNLPFRSSLTI